MSRLPRAGTAGRPVTIRATDAERAAWARAAKAEEFASLSAWIVMVLNKRAGKTKAGTASGSTKKGTNGNG